MYGENEDELFMTPPTPPTIMVETMMEPTGSEIWVSKTEKGKPLVYYDNIGHVWAKDLSEKNGTNVQRWRCQLKGTVESQCDGSIWLQKIDEEPGYKFIKTVTEHEHFANVTKIEADKVS